MNKYKSRKDVPDKYKWDLTDFFKDEKDFDKTFKEVENDIKKIKNYVGCTKDSKILYEFLKFDLEISTKIDNLYVYAMLKNDEELGISKNIDRLNKMTNLYTDYSTSTNFFVPELISLSKEEYNKLFDNKDLLEHKHWLDETYRAKDHVLSENEENIIDKLTIAMNNYSDISSNMLNNENDYGTVKIDGEDTIITSTNYGKLMRNDNREIRKEIFKKFHDVINMHAVTSASLLDSYVKANNLVCELHKYKDAWDAKLFGNHVPQKAYDTLVNTVEANTSYCQKYYKLFKDTLNIDELHQYDLGLELVSKEKKYTIEEAIDLNREALRVLGEDYIKRYNKIIDNHYIDFCEYKGKCSGGYSVSTLDHDSRILLSFNEYLWSVSTIIHECGHNIHHQLVMANNPKQYITVGTLVGEVASLTNECLLSSYLAKNGKTKEEKLAGISNILDVIMSNLFGAVREGKMEVDFNKYSKDGNALTKDYLNELTSKSLNKYYGKEVIIDENGDLGWVRRSHYYSSYYLYDYAFCISVASANALRILNGDKDALDKYIKFLSLGSDTYPTDAFKVLGFDLTDPKVYEDAIKYFDSLIEEFKKISKE